MSTHENKDSTSNVKIRSYYLTLLQNLTEEQAVKAAQLLMQFAVDEGIFPEWADPPDFDTVVLQPELRAIAKAFSARIEVHL